MEAYIPMQKMFVPVSVQNVTEWKQEKCVMEYDRR